MIPNHDWAESDTGLRKTFAFASFPDALAFVNRVGDVAETWHHHPDIDIRYNWVTLNLFTKDAGRVTWLDHMLAVILTSRED